MGGKVIGPCDFRHSFRNTPLPYLLFSIQYQHARGTFYTFSFVSRYIARCSFAAYPSHCQLLFEHQCGDLHWLAMLRYSITCAILAFRATTARVTHVCSIY